MLNKDDEKVLIKKIHLAIEQKNEQMLDKIWDEFINMYVLTDDLLAIKWQFYFDNHYFDIIIEEAEQLSKDFSSIYPQSSMIYLESYVALNQPEVALSLYYNQSFRHDRQWQLLLSKIQRAVDEQQKIYSQLLMNFESLDQNEKMILLEKILQSQSNFYIDAVIEIVKNSRADEIITWGLLYLQQENCNKEIVYRRENLIYIVKPSELPELQNSEVYLINQQILNYIAKHQPHLKEVAEFITILLFNRNYPKYNEAYSVEEWVSGIAAYYEHIILGMDLDISQDVNQIIIDNLK